MHTEVPAYLSRWYNTKETPTSSGRLLVGGAEMRGLGGYCALRRGDLSR
jgi:hypothetical protein